MARNESGMIDTYSIANQEASMTRLIWAKSEWDAWHMLRSVASKSIKGSGVYMIWHEGRPGRVVCVGHGNIAAQLELQRQDPSVLTCEMFGSLRVTWAFASPSKSEGIARYLADYFGPLLGNAGLTKEPIETDIPFAA